MLLNYCVSCHLAPPVDKMALSNANTYLASSTPASHPTVGVIIHKQNKTNAFNTSAVCPSGPPRDVKQRRGNKSACVNKRGRRQYYGIITIVPP